MDNVDFTVILFKYFIITQERNECQVIGGAIKRFTATLWNQYDVSVSEHL